MIKIKKAGPGDLETLQKISMVTFYEAFAASNSESDMQQYITANFTMEKLSAELHHADSQFYIARDETSAIGYLKVNCGPAQSDLQEDHSLEIERIYVLNAYHGKEVGQLLCDQAAEVAGRLAKSSVWLGVWEKNSRAIRFYEKNGFVAFGSHVFKMGEDEQTDILMRKPLQVRQA